MKIYTQTNFAAEGAISQGEICAIGTSGGLIAVADEANVPVGICGQTVAAGEAVALIPFATGTACLVKVTETVTIGDQLAIDGSGHIVKEDGTSGEKPLPLYALEAVTVSGSALVKCICGIDNAVNPSVEA